MIPRLKPWLGRRELQAACNRIPDAQKVFENRMASVFGCTEGIAFPYGRSALWACFKALGIRDSEIVIPAYTCSVVGHAVVLSGNIPRFVDINMEDYTMQMDAFEAAINERTRAVVPTHLFGYAMNVDQVRAIVKRAEEKYGTRIMVVQDAAHSFGAEWKGRKVTSVPDIALFGLNISKTFTSIFGGMIVTGDAELSSRIRAFRDAAFCERGVVKSVRRFLYLCAAMVAFNNTAYGCVEWLGRHTSFLNSLTKAYHLDDKIHFPPDHLDLMTALEARVGLEQLERYDEIVRRRRATAEFYDRELSRPAGWVFPPIREGAAYSHYVIRVPNREAALSAARRRGIQLGELIEYALPLTPPYRRYSTGAFPNAEQCSRTTINLPVFPSLRDRDRERVKALVDELANGESA